MNHSYVYKFDDVDRLPQGFAETSITLVPEYEVNITIVKLLKMWRPLAEAVYVLSDRIDEPGTTPYFLVGVRERDGGRDRFWLVSKDTQIWPVRTEGQRIATPRIGGRSFVVCDDQFVTIRSEEHDAVVKALKRYTDEDNG